MHRKPYRLAAFAASLALVVGACGSGSGPSPSTAPAAATSATLAASPAPTSHDLLAVVEVDGHKLRIACVGPIDAGRPTVIFEAGLGGDLGTWSAVLSDLQSTDRACAYERLGDGRSDPPPGPRTTADQVADVRALLAEVGVKPPFVLVGYSVGGWNVMVHNDAHPADVAGAVMVDVRPPGVSARWLAALPPAASNEPEGVRLNREDMTVFETDPSLNPEQLRLRESAAEAVATGGFGDKPLVVLAATDTAGISEGLSTELGATFLAIWWELQQAMADQSSAGRLERVERATHDMPYERTDAIIAAIRDVLGE